MKKIILPLVLLAILLCGCTETPAAESEVTETTAAVVESEPTTEAPTTESTEAPTEETTTAPTEPEELTVVSTATIVSTGDVLMHDPVRISGEQNDGSYDFSYIFQYIADYATAADYAVANLEGTLCGTDNGYPYDGYPRFNAPDILAQNLKDAGFDMLLTSNNHCYDTSTVGVARTLSVLEQMGVESLGTQATAEDPDYKVIEVNGIKIGMACYTFSSTQSNGLPIINGYYTKEADTGTISVFDASHPDVFYADLENQIALMRAEGAEAIMVYMHWGVEYSYKQNTHQSAMAQAMCDMGVDVIVGGHAHMVQPMALLTSTVDESHKTVCLYSMGNAVSNQRDGYLKDVKTAHTEDGVLFSVTFARYSDGTVALQATDLIPCWVNMYYANGIRMYEILPLDMTTVDQWQSLYDLADANYQQALKSYDRTMELVGAGLEESRTWLAEAEAQRMADYLEAQK